MNDYTWMVGGESGEGIDTTGELFALALCRMGYHVHGERLFPSRIRGGHTHYQLRIADRSLRAPSGRIDCLVAFDQGSIDWNWRAMAPGGLIVHDAVFRAQLPAARDDLRAVAVPLSDLASAIGDAIMKNMVAVGVSAALLGLPVDPFLEAAASRFAGKGPEIAAANAELVRRGHAEGSRLAAAGAPPFAVRPDPPPSGRHRYLLSGNEALAYGALAAGCRFVAAYPITPATEIMQWLQRELPAYGGAVVQCEDELAAVNMVVGAAFAGARAMASTSGPGFSLMTEGLGLAGATEQPIVIVDDQRAGPSTGLPTRSEQSDLQHAAWGGHGEFPRIVITPLGVEDCFAAAVDAFNLAERYQCPVILAPDLGLAMCRQSIDGLDFARVRIERGALADPEALASPRPASRRAPCPARPAASTWSPAPSTTRSATSTTRPTTAAPSTASACTSSRASGRKGPSSARGRSGPSCCCSASAAAPAPSPRRPSGCGRRAAPSPAPTCASPTPSRPRRWPPPWPAPRPCWSWRATASVSWRTWSASTCRPPTGACTAACTTTARRCWRRPSSPRPRGWTALATLAEFRALRPTWCPGCGDFAVLAALQRALVALGLRPQDVVVVGGIGCSGKIAGYVGCYGFHGLHGRALPVATGVKLANRALTVVAAGGDGDGYGIGLGHFLHAVRRNVDITYIVMDNHIYGLTKGQASPTSAAGFKGTVDRPVHPLLLALASGGTFVAQSFSGNVNHLTTMIERAIRHPGFSLVNVFSPCVTYNQVNTYEFYRDHLTYVEDLDYRPVDRTEAIALVSRYNDLVCGVLYEGQDEPTFDAALLQGAAGPIAAQNLAADRRWERIIERYA
jgi:2-oxoacid:acceptor oxidoreductase alpha subunit/2-oxoacid:acceptor oxidoreductase beta subunit (pyruvate/2-ketoisovalerate family)